MFNGADASQPSCSPVVEPQVAAKQAEDERKVAELVAKGTPAVKVVYDDGGQHESFRTAMAGIGGSGEGAFAVLDSRPRRGLGEVSRPEALAQGPREIPIEPGGRTRPDTALAFADAAPKAAPAKPAARAVQPESGRTVVARNPEPATAPATPQASPTLAGEDRPFYKRMFGNLIGGGSSQPDTETAQAAPQGPTPAPAASGRPKPAAKSSEAKSSEAKTSEAKTSEKPQALKPQARRAPATPAEARPEAAAPTTLERRADASGILLGAQPILQTGLAPLR